MRLINSDDADKRERLEKIESEAKQAATLVNRYEEIIRSMQQFAVTCGVPAEQSTQINPIGFCHDRLVTFAVQKLRAS